MVFFEPKVGRKIIFAGYWKVFVLNFLVMGNAVFFLSQEVNGKMIFTNYGKFLVLDFLVVENTVFFESRSWWKYDI